MAILSLKCRKACTIQHPNARHLVEIGGVDPRNSPYSQFRFAQPDTASDIREQRG